jgi:branched-chain amino acid aminotransferase
MIWFRGEIVSDHVPTLSVLDRTVEHGLGLFETFRTWNRHPTLFSRHRERMLSSAALLGLAVDTSLFPDERAVADIVQVSQDRLVKGPFRDHRLRIILSGGVSSERQSGGQLLMTAGPLPQPIPATGAVITRSIQIAPDDPLARHKTLNYWRKRIAYESAAADGCDEVLCVTPTGFLCEGTRSNLFLVIGERLWTPSADGPLLPGIMRGVVLDEAKRLGIETAEASLSLGQIAIADEAFLTSSIRGVAPIARLMDHPFAVPGPVTSRLWKAILPWLETGGTRQ